MKQWISGNSSLWRIAFPLAKIQSSSRSSTGHEIVYFPVVLITRYQGVSRPLRFSLTMPDRSFVHFDVFQRIYQDSPGIHSLYFSNPLDVDWNNRQANRPSPVPHHSATT